MKLWLVGLLALSGLVACSDKDAAKVAVEPVDRASEEQVQIYRDAYHTPHVVADSNRGVFYGYGYVVASDRLFQMEMLKRTAEGRVAEALGSEYLALDVFLRTSYDHRSVRRNRRHLHVLILVHDARLHLVDFDLISVWVRRFQSVQSNPYVFVVRCK